jgi:hypothetical protein
VFLIGNPYANPSDLDKYVRFPYPDVLLAKEQLRPVTTETGGKVSVYDMNEKVPRKAIAACKGVAGEGGVHPPKPQADCVAEYDCPFSSADGEYAVIRPGGMKGTHLGRSTGSVR